MLQSRVALILVHLYLARFVQRYATLNNGDSGKKPIEIQRSSETVFRCIHVQQQQVGISKLLVWSFCCQI